MHLLNTIKTVRYLIKNSANFQPTYSYYIAGLDKNLTMCHSGTKVSKFLYVKIPKTGSSTLLGIFSRFALNYSLKILRPTKCHHLLKKTNCENTNTNNPGKQ